MFDLQPATRMQILERIYGKSEGTAKAKANQPLGESAKLPEEGGAERGSQDSTTHQNAAKQPGPKVKQRALTKAERAEFEALSVIRPLNHPIQVSSFPCCPRSPLDDWGLVGWWGQIRPAPQPRLAR